MARSTIAGSAGEASVFIRSASQRNVIDKIVDLLREFRGGQLTMYSDVTIRGSSVLVGDNQRPGSYPPWHTALS